MSYMDVLMSEVDRLWPMFDHSLYSHSGIDDKTTEKQLEWFIEVMEEKIEKQQNQLTSTSSGFDVGGTTLTIVRITFDLTSKRLYETADIDLTKALGDLENMLGYMEYM